MKKKFVIVGGGTAGWLSALYAKQTFPEHDITLIESSEIGILGAGEGSTPSFVALLDYLKIPLDFLIKNTQSTIKTSIRFTNWSQNANFYHHGFNEATNDNLGDFFIKDRIQSFDYSGPSLSHFFIKDNKFIDNNDFVLKLGESKKIPFIFNNNVNIHNNVIGDFDQYGRFAVHFDAKNLASVLSFIGQERGIKLINSKVVDFTFIDSDIESIILENEQIIKTDFVIDCTGFSRLIIGKLYKSEWKSYSESLPMKKALPFFIKNNDITKIEPYTDSIAMNYGWMWKIPLQHRYGCGYVFDSDFINEEDAVEEIKTFLGFEPEFPRGSKGTFNFSPGCYKEIWIGNCIAIGLSSSFIEPLEATSIMHSILILKRLFSYKYNLFNRKKEYQKRFNEKILAEFEQIVDIIYLHYMTDKKTNKFWSDFTKNNKIPKSLEEKIYYLNNAFMTEEECQSLWGPESYYLIAKGIGFLDKEYFKNVYNINNFSKYEELRLSQELVQNRMLLNFIGHYDFIKYMGGFKI